MQKAEKQKHRQDNRLYGVQPEWLSLRVASIMFSLQRLLFLAALPVILLLGIRKTESYFTSSGLLAQFQSTVSPWIPQSTREFIIGRPRVTLRQGTVVGVTVHDTLKSPVDAFRGIPYALSPVGDRRFRAAVPVEASDGVFNASQFGAR